LVLVRHGETDFNVEGRMQGHFDSELTEVGLAQARRVAPQLARYAAARLLSSDLSRAARTAEEVGLVCDLPVKIDPRLRETDLGQWQALTPDEVEGAWPGALAIWRTDPTWAPPGGESRLDVAVRSRPVIGELEAEFDDPDPSTALICAHGGLITALSCALIGLAVPSWMAVGGLGNARWVILQRRESEAGWRLTGYNVGPLD